MREGRNSPREVLGDPFLIAREQAEGETTRPAKQLVHRRLPAHAHADERRLERKPDERADGEAEPLPSEVHGQGGDPGGEASQQETKVVLERRQRRRSTSSASTSESSSRWDGSTSASWS